MNEIPLSEILWQKWFVISCVLTFFAGCLFVTAAPFIKWDLYRARIYCELLNIITDGPIFQPSLFSTLAQTATARLGNRKYTIVYKPSEAKFTVVVNVNL